MSAAIARYLWPVLLTSFALLGVSCSRSLEPSHSVISIQTPISSLSGQSRLAAWPTAPSKICYGVNVVGSDLESSPSSCGPTKGIFSHFFEPGETISLTVKRGTNRTVELYAYVLPMGEGSCPDWSFSCNDGRNCNLYKVASVSNVSMDAEQTSVTMAASFPGWSQHVVNSSSSPAICQGSLRAMLNSSGSISDTNGNVFSPDFSHPRNDSLYTWNGSGEAVRTDGGSTQNNVQFPTYVRSITIKPESGRVFGLVGRGKIVELTSDGKVIYFTDQTCPFRACEIPPWMQSISAGLDSSIYGLDHGGNIYRIWNRTSLTKVRSVSPYVTQVSFF